MLQEHNLQERWSVFGIVLFLLLFSLTFDGNFLSQLKAG